MASPPMALGYLRTDSGSYPERRLTDDQVRFRRQAIEACAAEKGLLLKGLYVEDDPGSRQILSRMFAAAYFYIAGNQSLDAIIIFDTTDLGVTGTVQSQIRERIDDLGVRLEIVSEPDSTNAE